MGSLQHHLGSGNTVDQMERDHKSQKKRTCYEIESSRYNRKAALNKKCIMTIPIDMSA